MTNDLVKKFIYENAEEDYCFFIADLDNDNSVSYYGVRIPKIRKFIKEHPDYDVDSINMQSREERMIALGLVLNQFDNFYNQIRILKMNERYLTNWELVDFLVTYFAPFKVSDLIKDRKLMLDSSNPFMVRLFYSLAIKIYKQNGSCRLLNYLFPTNHHYIIMAEAWMLSTYYFKYKDMVVKILKRGAMVPALKRLTIQKIKESLKATEEDKLLLDKLKTNII